MSEVILKLGLDIVIVVRDPGFDVGSHHVRRAGRVVCGGMPNQKTKVLRREHSVSHLVMNLGGKLKPNRYYCHHDIASLP
jgi:hypothetical protein